MTEEELRALEHGDIIRHKTGNAYVVVRSYGEHAVAVRTVDVANPPEWVVVKKHNWDGSKRGKEKW